MDSFTHLLIGLIVASLADGSNLYLYTALAVFMSLLPDMDFVLFPLWKYAMRIETNEDIKIFLKYS